MHLITISVDILCTPLYTSNISCHLNQIVPIERPVFHLLTTITYCKHELIKHDMILLESIPCNKFHIKGLLHDRPSGSEKDQPEGKNVARGRRPSVNIFNLIVF